MTFVNRCKAEKLTVAMTAADVDKLLAETGCAVPAGAVFSIRKELAAAFAWLRAHKTDTAEQFDALPDANKEVLKGLYICLPDVPGMHWSRKIFRLLHAFTAVESPIKSSQAPPVGEEKGLGEEQPRPNEGEDALEADKALEERAKRTQLQREDEALLAAGIELCIAKRQKDKSVLSPASLKNAAAFEEPGAGGAGYGKDKVAAAQGAGG